MVMVVVRISMIFWESYTTIVFLNSYQSYKNINYKITQKWIRDGKLVKKSISNI